MSHLDEKSGMNVFGKGRKRPKTDAKVRTGIVNVLANIVSIAAGESIGRNLLSNLNKQFPNFCDFVTFEK